jgi:uncharacterized protein (DUF433 family)
MISGNRIAGTRITVWDVLHHLEHGWKHEEIAEVFGLSVSQIQSAVDYIEAHRSDVMAVHREIEERNGRGNRPDVEVAVRKARAKRLEWLEQHAPVAG